MTEQMAIEHIRNLAGDYKCWDDKISHEESLILCKLLDKLEQYRTLGIVEELRVAKEKQIPKKPSPIDYKKYIDVVKNAKFLRGGFWCPNCKHVVYSGCYCADCGQKLDWSDEE